MTKIFKIGKNYELQVEKGKHHYLPNAFVPIAVWWEISEIIVGTQIGKILLYVTFRKLKEVR